MKIIIAPDKFKGSLTSFDACNNIAEGIRSVIPQCEIKMFPMADGGDGFARVLQYYLDTTTVTCKTVDPLGRKITASYQWDEKTKTAIIEMASASGLVLLKQEERNPMKTSTLGTGRMIEHAVEKGAQKIVLGIGGSATNDAGTGILSALGFRFYDKLNKEVTPCGGNLAAIGKITIPSPLPNIQFEIACDVNNVLYGTQGAAFIYAPQKGATPEEVLLLDKGLQHFAAVIKNQTGKDVSSIAGSGAAGGIAAGLLPFFNARIIYGIDLMCEASGIEKAMNDTDYIFTGEGKLDDQSSEGKVIGKIAAMGQKKHIPVIALCGMVTLNEAIIQQLGLTEAYEIGNPQYSLEENMKEANNLLRSKTISVLKDIITKTKS